MKAIKQFYKDMLAWWEESFQDKKFRDTLIWLLGIVVTLGVILALAFPSSAAVPDPEDPYYPAVPSDLTGYRVTVPSGWSAIAGYGRFFINGTFGQENINEISIGYNPFTGENVENFIGITNDNSTMDTLYPNMTFEFTVTGGSDADEPSLIQWLANNGAYFVMNIVPPDPEAVTIPAGTYYLQNPSNNLRGTISFNHSFSTLVGTSYNSLVFARYSNTNLVDIQYNEDSIYNGYNGFGDVTNSVIIIHEPETLTSEESTLFNEAFVRVDSENKLLNLFNAALDYGYTSGHTVGYNTGYDTGYEEGFTDGAENAGGNFFGNFIESILNALDKLVLLPGDISFLDIIKAIGGIFVVIWLLKLLAGG